MSGDLQKLFLLKGQSIIYVLNSQRDTNISLGKCGVLSNNGVCRAAYLERVRFASEAGGDFAIHYSFKGKCSKNWYRYVFSCVLRSLKAFCMANSAVYLDVNIALSKYRFNGVAFFEIVRFGLQKTIFVANIYLSKYAARWTQFFERTQHFQRLMFVSRWVFQT